MLIYKIKAYVSILKKYNTLLFRPPVFRKQTDQIDFSYIPVIFPQQTGRGKLIFYPFIIQLWNILFAAIALISLASISEPLEFKESSINEGIHKNILQFSKEPKSEQYNSNIYNENSSEIAMQDLEISILQYELVENCFDKLPTCRIGLIIPDFLASSKSVIHWNFLFLLASSFIVLVWLPKKITIDTTKYFTPLQETRDYDADWSWAAINYSSLLWLDKQPAGSKFRSIFVRILNLYYYFCSLLYICYIVLCKRSQITKFYIDEEYRDVLVALNIMQLEHISQKHYDSPLWDTFLLLGWFFRWSTPIWISFLMMLVYISTCELPNSAIFTWALIIWGVLSFFYLINRIKQIESLVSKNVGNRDTATRYYVFHNFLEHKEVRKRLENGWVQFILFTLPLAALSVLLAIFSIRGV